MGGLYMSWENPLNNQIKNLLQDAKRIADIALSDKPERTSYQIAKAMLQSGYKIIPINPNVDEVLNEKSYQSLKEVEEEIDIVNVFRRSEHLPAIANEAKDLNIKGFWAQQGVIHEDVPTILEKNDALVMMDLCIKVAHATLVK